MIFNNNNVSNEQINNNFPLTQTVNSLVLKNGLDNIQDYSVFTLDNELKINSWNSGATKILQYETTGIIGKHFEIIFTEEDKKNNVPNLEIQRALKEGKAADSRWYVCKDGTRLFANGLVIPLIGKSGEKTGYVKMLSNIEERKRSEDALNKYVNDLEKLNEHKERILAILSHDLRSPLNRIIALSTLLKSDFDKMGKEEVKEMISFLYDASKEELKMLDYMLEWARIKYATETFYPAQINLGLYTMKVFDILKQAALVNEVDLVNEIDPGINVFADGKMVLSILQNIISNAIKFSIKGGKIIVTVWKRENKIVVEIRDNGIGMSNQVQKDLFTPEMNSLSKIRRENKGAGIGLLLAKSLVEKNSGEIWVRSKEGEGTSFYFSLPLNKPL